MVAASPRNAANAVRVIFLGPPGAGKGTQAARLATHLGVPKIGTGEMLRTAIAKNTPLGQKAHPLMEKGNLVPDDLLVALVRERIAEPDCGRGFVLDGFPRTLPQARGLEEMTGGDAHAWVVFDFEVPAPRAHAAALRPALVPVLPGHVPPGERPPEATGGLRRVRDRARAARGRPRIGGGAAAPGVRRAHVPADRVLPHARADGAGRRQPPRWTWCSRSCSRRWRCGRERPEVLERAPDDGARLPDRGRHPRRARGGRGARRHHEGDGPHRPRAHREGAGRAPRSSATGATRRRCASR